MICGEIKDEQNRIDLKEEVSSRRHVMHKTTGSRHGPISRLISPSDLGQTLKPFVFLDDFSIPSIGGFKGFGWHPHSGIATVTVLLKGQIWFEETTAKGIIETGGVEYFQAGHGAWHQGGPDVANSPADIKGYQLWVSLPESLENAPPLSKYLNRNEIPTVDGGKVRLILGSYNGASSSIPLEGLNYLDISLESGERWVYETPTQHNVAFLTVSQGDLRTVYEGGAQDDKGEQVKEGELVVFSEGNGNITVEAGRNGPVRFILGSAERHPHDLVCGRYSVHTSSSALVKGESQINLVGKQLKEKGLI